MFKTKKKEKKDLLELLEKEYPGNSYVQKVSKTFQYKKLKLKLKNAGRFIKFKYQICQK